MRAAWSTSSIPRQNNICSAIPVGFALNPHVLFTQKRRCLRARLARRMGNGAYDPAPVQTAFSKHHSSAATAGGAEVSSLAPTTEKPTKGKMWEHVSAIDDLFYPVPSPVNYRLGGLNTQQFRSTCKPWIVWKRRCSIHLNFRHRSVKEDHRLFGIEVPRHIDESVNVSGVVVYR